MMKLRYRFIAYILILHIIFSIPAVLILRENRLMLFVIEIFYLVSLSIGFMLIRLMFKPLNLIATGSELIEEEDFITTLRPTGHHEFDKLINLFNSMLIRLRHERLQTEEQHFFLEALINAIPSGLIILDLDNRIDTVNPGAEKMLGLAGRKITGMSGQEVGEPISSVIEMLSNENAVVVPFRGNRRLRCYKSQFIDRGFPRTFILIEELTEEIRKTEKTAYDKLIRMMSHEVNNSVGSVSSLLQSSLNYAYQVDVNDRDDFTNALDVSINRLRNLNSFMKQYADIIRLPQPRFNQTDIVAVLERCANLFYKDSEAQSITWNWDICEKFPKVRCDQAQMEQVFINIFKNAIEAIGTDGEIGISCITDGSGASIIITDTGSGIPPEVQKQLFSPFFSTKKNGQGIGLTLVREILERHGFLFTLESSNDHATAFIINIIHKDLRYFESHR